MTTATTLSNTDLAHAFYAEQDRLRGGPAPELCASDYQAFLGGNPAMNRAEHEEFARAFYAGFPDLNHTVERVFADGDQVAVRLTIRGTHAGTLFGIPATNRPATIVANMILVLRDGRVSQLYGMFDEAGMLRQIGVLPA
jgi:predicted ester cyclase